MTCRRRLLGGLVGAAAVVVLLPGAARASVAASFSRQTSPGAYNFGAVTGETTIATTFHLTNAGSTNTPALRIRITGSSAFRKMRDTCKGTRLAKGERCVVRITYAPPVASGESDSATLAATNLAGTATIASLALTGGTTAGTPSLQITPAGYDFGSTSGTQSFDITNTGTAPAYLQTLEVSTPDSPPLLGVLNDVNDFCGLGTLTPMAPGQTCLGVFTLTYAAPSLCGSNRYAAAMSVRYAESSAFTNLVQAGATATAEDVPC
jgi:hypothetical protein